LKSNCLQQEFVIKIWDGNSSQLIYTILVSQKAEEMFICHQFQHNFPYMSPANPAQQLGVENGAHIYARFLNKILAKVLHAFPRLSTCVQKHSSAFVVAAKCIHGLAHTHLETGRCC